MTILYLATVVDGTSDGACLSRGRFEPGVGHEPSLATWTTIDKTFGFNPATKKKRCLESQKGSWQGMCVYFPKDPDVS